MEKPDSDTKLVEIEVIEATKIDQTIIMRVRRFEIEKSIARSAGK